MDDVAGRLKALETRKKWAATQSNTIGLGDYKQSTVRNCLPTTEVDVPCWLL